MTGRRWNDRIEPPGETHVTASMAQRCGFSENLGYLLNRCAAQMAAQFERKLAPHDISLAQWGALLAIHDKGAASPSDVADRVGIDRGATTRLLARMEAKDFITRRSHEEDGRSVLLELSPATAAKMPDLLALSQRVNREALATLPPDEAEALLTSLSNLLTNLKA